MAIPLTVEWVCEAVAMEEAYKRSDVDLLTGALRDRIETLAALLGKTPWAGRTWLKIALKVRDRA